MYSILIVDDEAAARYGMRRALANKPIQIYEAENADVARRLIQVHRPDLLLTDINMPGEDGISLIRSLSDFSPRPLAIMITAFGTARVAVDAMKAGAYDYITKPFEIDELRLAVDRALNKLELERENQELRRQIVPDGQFGAMMGKTAEMQHLFAAADQVAATDATVLIQGESGTGKELLAREIHNRSPRGKGAFVAVNCAALPDSLIESELFGHEKGAFTGAAEQRKGKFELAHHGTLFLDEIGDMNALTQAKVLRAIEERRIERLGGTVSVSCDVRIISATHKELGNEVNVGRFRQDLFYRLKVVTLNVPALRHHRQDLPMLIQTYLTFFSARHKKGEIHLSEEAQSLLMNCAWPGNVREVRNVIEGCVVLSRSSLIKAADLPPEIHSPLSSQSNLQKIQAAAEDLLALPYKEAKKQFEIDYIQSRLRQNGGNVSKTAAQIGLHRQSLQQKLRELGIQR